MSSPSRHRFPKHWSFHEKIGGDDGCPGHLGAFHLDAFHLGEICLGGCDTTWSHLGGHVHDGCDDGFGDSCHDVPNDGETCRGDYFVHYAHLRIDDGFGDSCHDDFWIDFWPTLQTCGESEWRT